MDKKIQFINSGTYGCVYSSDFSCTHNRNDKIKYISKIQKNNNSLVNEIEIMSIIKKNIENYYLFYAPIIKVCNVNFDKLSNSEFNKCELFDNYDSTIKLKKEFVSLKMRYIGNYDINEYIYSLPPLLQLKKINHIYYLCLQEIKLLNDNNIIHFDIKNNNIMYDTENHIPILIDFGLSFNIKNLYDSIFSEELYIFWCIDIFIIGYFKINKIEKNKLIEYAELNKIFMKYAKYTDARLSKKMPTFKKEFMEIFDSYFSKFIGKKWENLISDLKRPKTWDNYSLAVNIILMKTIPDHIRNICTKIILSPPNKRPTCSETIDELNNK